MKLKYKEEVLLCLTTSAWKTSGEIYAEISDRWRTVEKRGWLAQLIGLFNPELAEILSDASFGGIYNALNDLEQQDLIEKRNRHRDKRFEWRLKPGGRRSHAQGEISFSNTLQTA